MMMQFTSAAFFRLQPNISMQKDMMFSNTAMTVEKLAKVMNRKNSAPQSLPPAIFTNTLGRVTKIRLGPAAGFHAVAEAGGEDDHDRDIRATKVSRPQIRAAFTGQRVVLAHIAAENLHGGNAQAQGEEGLVHGGGDHVANAHLFDGPPESGTR